VNTLAGSGSIFTLASLIFFGLPADIANGTNRIGTTFQTITAVSVFRKHEKGIFDWSKPYIIPSILGGVLGAWVATDIDKRAFDWVIGGIMLFLLVLILVNPKSKLKTQVEEATTKNKKPWVRFLVFTLVGFYGGFIQAGIGILLLVSLVALEHFTMARANVVKVILVFAFSIPVFLVFVYKQQVAWVPGCLLAVGQVAGSLIAAKFVIKYQAQASKWIRALLIIMILLTEAKLFGLFDWVFG